MAQAKRDTSDDSATDVSSFSICCLCSTRKFAVSSTKIDRMAIIRLLFFVSSLLYLLLYDQERSENNSEFQMRYSRRSLREFMNKHSYRSSDKKIHEQRSQSNGTNYQKRHRTHWEAERVDQTLERSSIDRDLLSHVDRANARGEKITASFFI